MAVTVITALPPAPQRNSSPETFIAKADAHVAALTPWTSQVNLLGGEIEVIGNDAATAETSATASAAAAIGAANFVGNWGDLTGALNIPSSVAHNDDVWLLLVNLADVTTSEPGVTTDWLNLTIQAWESPKTAAFTPERFRRYPCDISAGGFTVTLPGTLAIGEVFVLHAFGGADTNTVLVARNGHTITYKDINIDGAGDGNLTLEDGDTVTMVAVTASQVEIS